MPHSSTTDPCTLACMCQTNFITLTASSKVLHLSWWPFTMGNPLLPSEWPNVLVTYQHWHKHTHTHDSWPNGGNFSCNHYSDGGKKKRGRGYFVYSSVSVLEAMWVKHKWRRAFVSFVKEWAKLTVRKSHMLTLVDGIFTCASVFLNRSVCSAEMWFGAISGNTVTAHQHLI